MRADKLHADEVDIDTELVRRLLTEQFPDWAELPIEVVGSGGTVNVIYRLGERMAVRMPRVPDSLSDLEHEHRWLPKLAGQLPLEIPVPLAMGEPGAGFPFPWSVYEWLEGAPVVPDQLDDPERTARELAEFVAAMREVDTTNAPACGRGEHVTKQDAGVRTAIPQLTEMIDTEAAVAAWEGDSATERWGQAGVWLHGDLLPGNLLANDGRISAVIDFGAAGIGDPACDAIPAWAVFSGSARTAFREGLDVDDATWTRGRAWALSIGLIALPYYKESNPEFAAVARRMIDEVLLDHGA